jgi:hypothetical protein
MFLTVRDSFDYNEQNGGISFKTCHKDWRQYQMVQDFLKWGIESFGESLFCLKEYAPTHQHF